MSEDRGRRRKNMKLNRYGFTLTCLVGFLLAAGVARAQSDYPNKPVRIISDSAPGSAVDVGLRIIADGLSRQWGQQAVVENRPGAGGAISAQAAAAAAPDGYTLYAPALSVFLAVPGKAPNLPIVLPRDFLPVGYTVDQPITIGVSPTLGVDTLAELIALAKQKPGKISYAVTGVGRLTHLTGELLQIRADIELQMVPYTSGSAHALSDVLGGRIDMMIEGHTGLSSAFESGQLKPLAVASAQRLPDAPNLPTVAETIPGFIATGWQAVVVPLGTPAAIIHKAGADLRTVLVKPDIKEKLAARGSYVRPMTPEQVLKYINDQQASWKPALDRIAGQMQK
jgi:tripartite-type tricarboxylate transporter receptor subunit TctC